MTEAYYSRRKAVLSKSQTLCFAGSTGLLLFMCHKKRSGRIGMSFARARGTGEDHSDSSKNIALTARVRLLLLFGEAGLVGVSREEGRNDGLSGASSSRRGGALKRLMVIIIGKIGMAKGNSTTRKRGEMTCLTQLMGA